MEQFEGLGSASNDAMAAAMEPLELLPQIWAKPVLGEHAPRVLEALESGITVRLIATPRNALRTCSADAVVRDAVFDAAVARFDFLPVVEEGAIVGLLHRVPFVRGRCEASGLVKDHMLPLSEDRLIAAGASVLAFIEDADRRRCRLVVGDRGVEGLVTLSDLQRLAVRPVLFLLITHFEILMLEIIRRRFGDGEGWFECLNSNRQNILNDRWKRLLQQDMAGDKLTATEFCDKVSILLRCFKFGIAMTQARRQLGRLERLRNHVAHAGNYASTPDDAIKLCETVRNAKAWIGRLNRLLEEITPA